MCDLEQIKQKLARLKEKDLRFNEPYFTNQMILREGCKGDVIENLLNPINLVYCYKQDHKVYCFYFKISNTRTMKLPVIFNKKGLYILTYIMRYRSWKGMIR
jgi:hypothetical protein